MVAQVHHLRLVLAVGLMTSTACLYRPPIDEKPIDWDDPPWMNVDGTPRNIDPASDQILFIDRFGNEKREFRVLEIRDPDPPEEIAYEFSVIWLEGTQSVQLVLESGTLIVDTERTEELQGSAYQGVEYDLDLCSEELKSAEQAVFRLELTDPIAPEQWAALETDRFVSAINWTMVFLGDDCAER